VLLHDGESIIGRGSYSVSFSDSEDSEDSAPATESYWTNEDSCPVLFACPIVLEHNYGMELIDPDVLASAMEA